MPRTSLRRLAAATLAAMLVGCGDYAATPHGPPAERSLAVRRLTVRYLSPGPSLLAPAVRVAAGQRELDAAWHDWRAGGRTPQRPPGSAVLLVWAGTAYERLRVERITWRGRRIVVDASAPRRDGCVRAAVVGAELEVLAVPPPSGERPLSTGEVRVHERERC